MASFTPGQLRAWQEAHGEGRAGQVGLEVVLWSRVGVCGGCWAGHHCPSEK